MKINCFKQRKMKIVNWALPSLDARLIEITLTIPLN